MNFGRLIKKQQDAKEESFILSEEKAEEQIFNLIQFYNIDLNFEVEGFISKDDLSQLSDDEKKAGIGIKQIIRDLENWIRRGVIEINRTEDDLIIKHNLVTPIGENSEMSEPMKTLYYKKLTPEHTKKVAELRPEKYTNAQIAEMIMAYASENIVGIIHRMGLEDKKACRSLGLLLFIAQ